MKALLFLELRTLSNAARNAVKNPKTLIPLLFMGLVALFNIGIFVTAGFFIMASDPAPEITPEIMNIIWSVIFYLLVGICGLSVIQAIAGGTLVFRVPDIDFVFPSPIPRRSVLAFKLLRDYVLSTAVMGFVILIAAPMVLALSGEPFLPSFFVVWGTVILLMLFLSNLTHTASIVLSPRLGRAMKNRIFQAAAIISFAAILAGAVWAGSTIGSEILESVRNGSILKVMARWPHSGTVRTIFFPITWAADLVTMTLGAQVEHPVREFLGLFALAVGSSALVFSRRENIYEPSIATSVRFAERRQAARGGDNWAVMMAQFAKKSEGRQFRSLVPPFGRGAMAILWKNTVVTIRMMRPVTVIMMVVSLFFFKGWFQHVTRGDSNPGMIWVLYFFGLQLSQGHTRRELKQSIMKTMPLRGWKVMLAQTAFQSVSISLLMLVMLVLVVPAEQVRTLSKWFLAMPAVVFAFAAGGNLAAMIYPNVSNPTQNFLSNIIGSLLGSVPIILSIMASVVLKIVGYPEYVSAAAASLLSFAVAAGWIALAGRLYDRFDSSAD